MDESSGSITMFLHQMMAGDEAAVAVLWERFLPRLLALSRKTLSRGHERMAGVEDAVQSAFASFWKRTTRGEFGNDLDRFDMWKLLSVITVRKPRKRMPWLRRRKPPGSAHCVVLNDDEAFWEPTSEPWLRICRIRAVETSLFLSKSFAFSRQGFHLCRQAAP
ncbi:MAG: hypothetical protein JNL58_27045 [Planctomyces sp.]|nr:hypothetical protein [Planctomyces sp.]